MRSNTLFPFFQQNSLLPCQRYINNNRPVIAEINPTLLCIVRQSSVSCKLPTTRHPRTEPSVVNPALVVAIEEITNCRLATSSSMLRRLKACESILRTESLRFRRSIISIQRQSTVKTSTISLSLRRRIEIAREDKRQNRPFTVRSLGPASALDDFEDDADALLPRHDASVVEVRVESRELLPRGFVLQDNARERADAVSVPAFAGLVWGLAEPGVAGAHEVEGVAAVEDGADFAYFVAVFAATADVGPEWVEGGVAILLIRRVERSDDVDYLVVESFLDADQSSRWRCITVVEGVSMLQLLFELFGDQWQADFPRLFVILQGIRVVAVSLQVDADVESYYP
jgi:hypothetical protein